VWAANIAQVGILAGINIDRDPIGMFGPRVAARHGTAVESGSVVRLHGGLIVTVIAFHGLRLSQRKAACQQRIEDGLYLRRNDIEYDHQTVFMVFAVEIDISKRHLGQARTRYRIIRTECFLLLHALALLWRQWRDGSTTEVGKKQAGAADDKRRAPVTKERLHAKISKTNLKTRAQLAAP